MHYTQYEYTLKQRVFDASNRIIGYIALDNKTNVLTQIDLNFALLLASTWKIYGVEVRGNRLVSLPRFKLSDLPAIRPAKSQETRAEDEARDREKVAAYLREIVNNPRGGAPNNGR